MSNNNSNGSKKEALSPIVVILLTWSLFLAMVDKDNRPVYFEIVDLVVVYSLKSERKIRESSNEKDAQGSKNVDNSDNFR
jgi:hypothetical protein